MDSALLKSAVTDFATLAVAALMVLLAALVLIGLANAFYVVALTLRSRASRLDDDQQHNRPPTGFISGYAYLHLLADVLMVVVGIELLETLVAFLDREDSEAYLAGAIGAALVALARRIIVFFDPEAAEVRTGEMYAYAALVAALAAAYAAIRYGG